MGIRDFLDRLRNKKQKYKEYAEDMKVQEQYAERRKSANERELERYQNEAREHAIKVELEKWRKSKHKEDMYGHQILNTKNMFVNEKPIILKNKKIFAGKSNLNTPGGLFFK
jgi:hypothetical protein